MRELSTSELYNVDGAGVIDAFVAGWNAGVAAAQAFLAWF